MAVIPICERIVTALTRETAYGTPIADTALVNMFHLINPDVPDISLDTVDDRAFLKGHEFLDDDSAYKILFQDVQFNLTGIPLSAEFAGWLMASAMGRVTSAQIGTTGDYIHTGKILDRCASDQLPSRSLGVLWSGSPTVNKKYAGAVVDSFTIRVTEKGFVTCDVSFMTDGTEEDGSAIAVPSTFHSTNFYYGLDCVLEYADFVTGGAAVLVDKSSEIASFELTYSNNLLVDEAKMQTLATDTKLPELRLGDRTIEISLVLYSNEASQPYLDALASTMKAVRFTIGGTPLSGGTNADLVFDIPRVRWTPTGRGFDGTKRTITLGHMIYMDPTLDTPLQMKATTRDSAYL